MTSEEEDVEGDNYNNQFVPAGANNLASKNTNLRHTRQSFSPLRELNQPSMLPSRSTERPAPRRPHSLVHKPNFHELGDDDDDVYLSQGNNDNNSSISGIPTQLINTQPDKPVVGHRKALSSSTNRRRSSLPVNNTSTAGSRPNSNAMWDELNSVRQRIEKLRTPGQSDDDSSNFNEDTDSTPTKKTMNNNNTPARRRYSRNSNREDIGKNRSDTPNSNNYGSRRLDAEQQHAHQSMSSPLPSKPPQWTPSASSSPPTPQLSRQTAAERHLLDVLEQAKRVRDHDISTVLLERVVTDTMYLYNHSDFNNTEPIDKLCLSLSDYILQSIQSTPSSTANNTNFNDTPIENNSFYTPPPPSRRYYPTYHTTTSSTGRTFSGLRTHQRYSSNPNNNYDHVNSGMTRSATIRSEMGGLVNSSPISRSQTFSPAAPLYNGSATKRTSSLLNNNPRRFDRHY